MLDIYSVQELALSVIIFAAAFFTLAGTAFSIVDSVWMVGPWNRDVLCERADVRSRTKPASPDRFSVMPNRRRRITPTRSGGAHVWFL